jgi:hypothetical protein
MVHGAVMEEDRGSAPAYVRTLANGVWLSFFDNYESTGTKYYGRRAAQHSKVRGHPLIGTP